MLVSSLKSLDNKIPAWHAVFQPSDAEKVLSPRGVSCSSGTVAGCSAPWLELHLPFFLRQKNHHSTGVWDRLCCWLHGTKGNMPRKQNPKPETIQNPVELECHWIWGCQVSRLHQVAEKASIAGTLFPRLPVILSARVPTWSFTRRLWTAWSMHHICPMLSNWASCLPLSFLPQLTWSCCHLLHLWKVWSNSDPLQSTWVAPNHGIRHVWMSHQPLQHLGGWAKSPEPPRSYPRMPGKGLLLQFEPIKKC